MYTHKPNWLDNIQTANKEFQMRINREQLPTSRTPGSTAIITCMDPRINLEAVGIQQFSRSGEGQPSVRIIRTIGGMIEERSLIVACFLAGINEIVVLMHTDCGCSLANEKIDTIIKNMEQKIESTNFEHFKRKLNNPFKENLRQHLMTFSDPYEAVKKEVERIRSLTYSPKNLIVHGLVYDLKTAEVEVVVNGY